MTVVLLIYSARLHHINRQRSNDDPQRHRISSSSSSPAAEGTDSYAGLILIRLWYASYYTACIGETGDTAEMRDGHYIIITIMVYIPGTAVASLSSHVLRLVFLRLITNENYATHLNGFVQL